MALRRLKKSHENVPKLSLKFTPGLQNGFVTLSVMSWESSEEMIPTTLDEAFKALDQELSDADRDRFRTSKEPVDDLAVEVHHTLGRYLRNKWGLWGDSPLAKHMREVHGVSHPDDMSHEIIARWCRQMIPSRWARLRDPV